MAGTGGRREGSGRKPGGKNKATIEREKRAAEESARELADARAGRRKLPKDILEQFAVTLAGMAAFYQPVAPGQPIPQGRQPDPVKFKEYAELAIYAAKAAAPYFHPTFKAVSVSMAPDQPGAPPGQAPTQIPGDQAKPVKGAEVIDLKDPKAMLRAYQKMVNGG